MASLQDSVDRLAGAFERMADRLEATEPGAGSDGDRFSRHVRRYMPFYALATVWALMIFLLPTRQADQTGQTIGQFAPDGSGVFTEDGSFAGPSLDGSEGGGASASTRGGRGGSRATAAGGSAQAPVPPETQGLDPLAWTAEGVTRGGFECGPGIRQLPWSAYAVPCFPKWSGDNGGATSRGVTDKEVVIVERRFPTSANDRATNALVEAAGFASEEERQATRDEFVKYFNKTFELWGRQVKIIVYESEFGDSTEEALSQGKEGACADADSIISKFEPFAVVGEGSTGVFGECAAERKLIVPNSGAYYPESWYRKYHPYLWNSVMECERIAYQLAEYMGKRLVGKPAKWAKRLQQGQPRVFGTYVPNNDVYQHCVDIAENELKTKYGVDPEKQSRYNYSLDISRFADQAANAIVQFNADGVTTIVLACDPLSPIFLTQSARGQEYFPEWITNGAGLTDVDQFARLWDQEEIQWSLFGMSQLGDNARILGPEGEGTITYKRATGTDIPPGAQVEYYATLGLFSALQAAGPILTPETRARGIFRMPPGGAPHFEVGYSSYQDGPDGTPGGLDHTGIDDNREIYWLCTTIGGGDAGGESRCQEPKGYDGAGGTYVPTYGGKRFRNGEWPREDPPVFPEKPS